MLNFLNGVFLAATMLANIVLYSDEDYPFPADRESVVAVSMHREFWREDGNGKCKYTGIMVPYVRDWPLVIKNGDSEMVLPPEPDKTAGHAFIINKKVCGDKVESVFRVGEVLRARGGFLYKHSFQAFDFTEMKKDDQPKWFTQVLNRIERSANTNTEAKEFLQFSNISIRDYHTETK